MCVVHWSILGHLLKELAGLVGEITLKQHCHCGDRTMRVLFTGRFLGIFLIFCLKKLAWLVGEISLKPSCLCRYRTPCVVHWSILGHLLKELAWLVWEITLKPSCPCRDRTPSVVDWSSLGHFVVVVCCC